MSSRYSRPPGGQVPPRIRASARSRRGPAAGTAAWLWRGRWQILFAVLILIGLTGTYVGWTLRDLPDPGHDDVLAGTVTVLDRKGQVIEERNPQGEFHIALHLDQMGTYGPAATLAAEDRSFYKHGAISFTGLLRA